MSNSIFFLIFQSIFVLMLYRTCRTTAILFNFYFYVYVLKKLRSCFPFVLFLPSLFLLLLLPVNISEYPGLLHVAPGPGGEGVGVVVLQHVAPDVVPGEKKAAMVKANFKIYRELIINHATLFCWEGGKI